MSGAPRQFGAVPSAAVPAQASDPTNHPRRCRGFQMRSVARREGHRRAMVHTPRGRKPSNRRSYVMDRLRTFLLPTAAAAALALGITQASAAPPNRYQQTNLVSDGKIAAAHTDPNLVNAWGVVF